jgi:hypothetical protein
MNESFFCISDLINLFKRKKNKIFLFSFFSFIIVFLYFAKFNLTYSSSSLFQEGNLKKGISAGIESIIFNAPTKQSSESFFKTQKLLKEVIEKVALQIKVIEDEKPFDRYKKNFLLNIKSLTYKKIKEIDFFEFENSLYEKEHPTILFLRFLDKNNFEVLDENYIFLTKAAVNEKVKINDFEFTLKKIIKNLKTNKLYKIQINPWIIAVNEFISNLEIKPSKINLNFLNLKYTDQNKYFTSLFLNTLMQTYLEKLKKENEEVNNQQLNFLKIKKERLLKELDTIFDESEDHLIKITKNSFDKNLDDQVANLNQLKNQLFLNIETIDKKVISLENFSNINNLNELNPETKEIVKKIEDLNFQKNQICLIDNKLNQKTFNENIQKLDGIQKEIDQNNIFLKNLKNFNLLKNVIFTKYQISLENENQKNEFEKYLQQRQKDLYFFKNLLSSSISFKNFDLLDLDTIEKKYQNFITLKDKNLSEIEDIKFIIKDIKNNKESFIFSNFLSDQTSLSFIDKIKKLNEIIFDEKNYFLKEKEKANLEKKIEKKYFLNHLQELLNIKKINLNNIKTKLHELNQLRIDAINKNIYLLEKNKKTLIDNQISFLKEEKEKKLNRLNFLKEHLIDLLKKKSLDNKLKLHQDITLKMLESTNNIIESKTIDHNLSILDSKIIDKALLPSSENKPKTFIYSCLAFILVFFISFVFFLYKAILNGFRISKNNLLAQNLNYLGEIKHEKFNGEIDKLSHTTKSSLRNVLSFIKDYKIISLLSAKSSNYTYSLAKLLSYSQRKVLIVDTTKEDELSLLHMIDKSLKKSAIRKLDHYDLLPLGKKLNDCFEILYSKAFLDILTHLKEKYDNIIFLTDLNIKQVEAKAFLKFSNKVIISFKEESLEDLKNLNIIHFENIGFLEFQ